MSLRTRMRMGRRRTRGGASQAAQRDNCTPCTTRARERNLQGTCGRLRHRQLVIGPEACALVLRPGHHGVLVVHQLVAAKYVVKMALPPLTVQVMAADEKENYTADEDSKSTAAAHSSCIDLSLGGPEGASSKSAFVRARRC